MQYHGLGFTGAHGPFACHGAVGGLTHHTIDFFELRLVKCFLELFQDLATPIFHGEIDGCITIDILFRDEFSNNLVLVRHHDQADSSGVLTQRCDVEGRPLTQGLEVDVCAIAKQVLNDVVVLLRDGYIEGALQVLVTSVDVGTLPTHGEELLDEG